MARVPSFAQSRPPGRKAGRGVNKQAIAGGTCPNCGSAEIRPSNRRNAVDILLGCVFLVPFRCRTCRKRFYKMWRPGLQAAYNSATVKHATPGPVLVMPVRRTGPEWMAPVMEAAAEEPESGDNAPQGSEREPDVAAEVEAGAEATVRIPAAVPHPTGASVPTAGVGRRSSNILILERDLSIRKLLRRVLERRGHSVVEIEQGDDLTSVLRRYPTDLLITGVLPDAGPSANTLEALVNNYPGLRILVLPATAFAFPDQSRDATARVLVLQKPFSLENFTDAVDGLLGQS